MKFGKIMKSILSWIMLYFDYVFVTIVELNFFANKNVIIWFY